MKCSSSLARHGVALAALALAAAPAVAQDKAETYNATAKLKTAAGASMTAPVVITIDRWTSDAQREKVIARAVFIQELRVCVRKRGGHCGPLCRMSARA